jgi:hypothetical protein
VQGSTRGCATQPAEAKAALFKLSGQQLYQHPNASRPSHSKPHCMRRLLLCAYSSSRCCMQVDCEPDYEQCSGTVCRLDEFCAGGRICKPNNCKERQQYACATDTSPLRSVTCVNATFTECYESQHFNCSIGASATVTSCSLKSQQSSSARPAAWLPGSKVRPPMLCLSYSAASV